KLALDLSAHAACLTARSLGHAACLAECELAHFTPVHETAPSPRRDGYAGTYRARARRAIDNRAPARVFWRRARAWPGGTTHRRCAAATVARARVRGPPRRSAGD